MKLSPNYSYEFNCILNESYSEDEQIQNFASLLSDKDRFLALLPILEKNFDLVEEKLGYNLSKIQEFFIVRAEKFKSFSLPVTIEYSILPEEMILFLLKEIVKTSITDRFPDEIIREVYVNSFIDHIILNGNWDKNDMVKYTKNLHDDSKKSHESYNYKEIDFNNKKMINYVEDLFTEEISRR